jgi:hypothetical protein
MAEERNTRPSWLDRRRERKRLTRERIGDSPEKREQHHTPQGDSVDLIAQAWRRGARDPLQAGQEVTV